MGDPKVLHWGAVGDPKVLHWVLRGVGDPSVLHWVLRDVGDPMGLHWVLRVTPRCSTGILGVTPRCHTGCSELWVTPWGNGWGVLRGVEPPKVLCGGAVGDPRVRHRVLRVRCHPKGCPRGDGWGVPGCGVAGGESGCFITRGRVVSDGATRAPLCSDWLCGRALWLLIGWQLLQGQVLWVLIGWQVPEGSYSVQVIGQQLALSRLLLLIGW